MPSQVIGLIELGSASMADLFDGKRHNRTQRNSPQRFSRLHTGRWGKALADTDDVAADTQQLRLDLEQERCHLPAVQPRTPT